MNTHPLAGTGVALVTPFLEDNSIDYDALKSLLLHCEVADYWVLLGTTGENVTINPEEKAQLIDFVLKHKPSNKPLVLGHGGNNTPALLAALDTIPSAGIDALLSVSPYYNKPNKAGLLAHFTALADKAKQPIILYNVPSRTGADMPDEVIIKLAQHPNIIGIKEASGNMEKALRLRQFLPTDFLLISGDDGLSIPFIAAGGDGVISVIANVFPEEFTEMVLKARQADFAAARALWYPMADINPLLYQEGNPVGIKALLDIVGISGMQVRLPLMPASPLLREKLAMAAEPYLS